MEYQSDIDALLARRHDNGGDYWASADGRLAVGDPFSTLTALLILHELGLTPAHEAVSGALALILAAWRDDGRYRLAPSGTLYPCSTARAACVLCRFGYAADDRLQRTFAHLLDTQYNDGGWRCNKFSFGRGPETEYSNPGATLLALDVFRFTAHLNTNPGLDKAVESLLKHWEVKTPLGPCHYGIGKLFMQTEYPFVRYNLFYYVYVLSFYRCARQDPRFHQALHALQTKLDADGRVVIERPHQKLADLQLCSKGRFSALATVRYQEILDNLK